MPDRHSTTGGNNKKNKKNKPNIISILYHNILYIYIQLHVYIGVRFFVVAVVGVCRHCCCSIFAKPIPNEMKLKTHNALKLLWWLSLSLIRPWLLFSLITKANNRNRDSSKRRANKMKHSKTHTKKCMKIKNESYLSTDSRCSRRQSILHTK